MSQPRRSLPDSRWTAMPHPRIASPHGCNYRLIPVPINPGGWSSRQTPSPRPIRQLCRSHSLMFETDRAHTKCMCVLSEEKMFSADFVVFSPSRGSQVLCRAKIPRAAPVATWRAKVSEMKMWLGWINALTGSNSHHGMRRFYSATALKKVLRGDLIRCLEPRI